MRQRKFPSSRSAEATVERAPGAGSVDLVSWSDLIALTGEHAEPCISVFMPTHRTGPGIQQDPLRLKNLLLEAAEQLRPGRLRSPEVRRLLQPAQDLVRQRLFWQHQADGLALFISPGWIRSYRLPLALPELVVVADRFHIKPLLPLFAAEGRFFVLALSQNEIRLLAGSRHTVAAVDLHDVPSSLEEALKYEDDPEKQRPHHVASRGGPGARVVFHGHGIGMEVQKGRILRYFQAVDRGLREVLGDGPAPLVLAGVEYLFAIYREANTYPHLLQEGIPGNPERLRPADLHRRAWTLVEPVFRGARQEAAARFRRLAGTGLTSTDLGEVLSAAHDGRVEILFVSIDDQHWGTLESRSGSVNVRGDPQSGDRDLVDVAAVETILTGGTVYAVRRPEVPGGDSLAAVLRY